jgi:hypothetical protein
MGALQRGHGLAPTLFDNSDTNAPVAHTTPTRGEFDGCGADEVGEEFDLVEAARGHAMAVARELSRNRLSHALDGHHISVVDQRGRRSLQGSTIALRPSKDGMEFSWTR